MLKALTVQGLAVVRSIDIEFQDGLTVFSGETGAGKSVLIEALGLALGERADSNLVRWGSDRATVTAVFDIDRCASTRALLEEHGIDDGKECLLRRTVSKDGRSRAFCNGSPIPVRLLSQIGHELVDVHAQHTDLKLLHRETQRRLLDEYGSLQSLVTAVNDAYEIWKQSSERLAQIYTANGQSDRHALVRYQIEELDTACLQEVDINSLEIEFEELANGAANLENCAAIRHALNRENDGVLPQLQSAATRSLELSEDRLEATALADLLNQSVITLEEALHELDRIETSIDVNPQRLQELDDRLAELHTLARKHNTTLEYLPQLHAKLCGELATFEQRDKSIETCRSEIEAANSAYTLCADELTKKRSVVAETMSREITDRMRELGIVGAVFDVSTLSSPKDEPKSFGRDRIEFVVTTNPGQDFGPLNKVASGGELSRIGLAIQAATAEHAGVPVVVYDEIDTGIGGTTANIVGQRLRDVARHCQVICITHSPQVASAGDNHLVVSKSLADGHTETFIRYVEKFDRETEISRMLGAENATKSSVAHARDLIATANQGN